MPGLFDVVLGGPHVSAHNDERHALNALTTLTETGRLSAAQLQAQISAAVAAGGSTGGGASAANGSAYIGDFGGGWNKTAAQNDKAIADGLATGRALIMPSYGYQKPYHISAPIVLADGMTLISDGMAYIVQDTNTADIVRITGSKNQLRGFTIYHNTLPSANQGNGIVSYAGQGGGTYLTHIEDVEIVNCGSSFKAESGFFFSNYMENLFINGYFKNALYFSNPGNTGSVWNNIYVNNQPYGTPLTTSDTPVIFEYGDDTVFNQLNIEHVNCGGQALLLNGMEAVTINALHIEGVSALGYDTQMVQAYGNTQCVISALEIVQCEVAPTGADTSGRSVIAAGGGAKIQVDMILGKNNTKTVAQTTRMAKAKDTGSVIWLPKMVVPDIFTGANIGDVRTFADSKDLVGLSGGGGGGTALSVASRTCDGNGGNQAIPSYTFTQILLPNLGLNKGTAITATAANQLTVTVAGYYAPSGKARFIGGTSAKRALSVTKNDVTVAENGLVFAGTGDVPVLNTPILCAAGDVLKMYAYVETGSVSVSTAGTADVVLALTYLGPA